MRASAEPPFDALILAGQPDFILRTAPVLAFCQILILIE